MNYTPPTIVNTARNCCLCVTCSDKFYGTESAKHLAVRGGMMIVDGGREDSLTFQVWIQYGSLIIPICVGYLVQRY